MRTQKGTQLREKRLFNASVDLQKKMDEILMDFADELVIITDFQNIEKLFIECAKDAVKMGMIRRNIRGDCLTKHFPEFKDIK